MTDLIDVTATGARPCPLCGGVRLMKQSVNGFQTGLVRWLHCEDCGCSGGHDYDGAGWEAVVAKWNRRAGEDGLVAKFNAAKKYISFLTRTIKSLGPYLPYTELVSHANEYETATGENAMENAETILEAE